ncbi:MAG: glycoside hydrolase family 2 protein, partial [Sphingomonadales bacterium]
MLADPYLAAAHAEDIPLEQGWRFIKQDVRGAEAAGFDDSGWTGVRVPHTYNAEDSGIGGAKARGEPEGVYYRGPAWYRLTIDHAPRPDTRYLLHFGGATLKADVWLNGRKLGSHVGGYAAFRFDATDMLKAGRNTLAVRVDNARNTDYAPLNGDFNIFGGLYRGVKLIAVPALHIDRLDHAGPGVQARTTALAARSATVAAKVQVRNDRTAAARLDVRSRIVDAEGRIVATATTPLSLSAGQAGAVDQQFTLTNPKRWEGRKSPYLYRVVSEVVDGGRAIDSQSVPLGVRTIAVETNGTVRLNGAPYRLHGVNLQHPTRFGRGPIVTDAEIDEDLNI